MHRLLLGTALLVATLGSGTASAESTSSEIIVRFIPQDVLGGMDALAPSVRSKLCRPGGGTVADLRSARPYPALSGLLSNMSNSGSLPELRSLEQFSGAVGEVSTTAYIKNNAALQAAVRQGLASWAAQDAYLGTIDCTKKKCAKAWQTKYGDDVAPIKDYDSVIERVTPIMLAYQLVRPGEPAGDSAEEDKVISEWLDAFAKRLRKWPEGGELRFGWGLNRSWTQVLVDTLAGNEKKLKSDLNKIAKGLDALVLADGSLKNATIRGSFATWKHFESLNEVLVTLEILKANGVDSYPKLEKRLHKSVKIMLDTFDDPKAIYPWAKKEFQGGGDYREQTWGAGQARTNRQSNSWFYIYSYRYPDQENTARIAAFLKRTPAFHQRDAAVGITLGCFYRANIPWMLERETQ